MQEIRSPREIFVLAGKMRSRWERQQISASTVENAAALETLDFYSEKFSLPADYVAFVRIAGLQLEADENMMRLWSPAELKCVGTFAASETNQCVIFADFMIDSLQYGLWTRGQNVGMVSAVTGSAVPAIIGSFRTFIELVLRDDPTLYRAE